MGASKTVKFPTALCPALNAVQAAIEGYFGEGAEQQSGPPGVEHATRFVLPGCSSDPFDAEEGIARKSSKFYNPIRCVEVYLHTLGEGPETRVTSVTIETRRADTFTRVVAAGLVDCLAGLWSGRRCR